MTLPSSFYRLRIAVLLVFDILLIVFAPAYVFVMLTLYLSPRDDTQSIDRPNNTPDHPNNFHDHKFDAHQILQSSTTDIHIHQSAHSFHPNHIKTNQHDEPVDEFIIDKRLLDNRDMTDIDGLLRQAINQNSETVGEHTQSSQIRQCFDAVIYFIYLPVELYFTLSAMMPSLKLLLFETSSSSLQFDEDAHTPTCFTWFNLVLLFEYMTVVAILLMYYVVSRLTAAQFILSTVVTVTTCTILVLFINGGCCTCCHLLCVIRFLFALMAVVRALVHTCMGWYQLYQEIIADDHDTVHLGPDQRTDNQRRRNYRVGGELELAFYQSENLLANLSIMQPPHYPIKLLVSPDTKKLFSSSSVSSSSSSSTSTVMSSSTDKTPQSPAGPTTTSSSCQNHISSGNPNLESGANMQRPPREDNQIIDDFSRQHLTYFDRLMFAWLYIISECRRLTLAHAHLSVLTEVHPAKAKIKSSVDTVLKVDQVQTKPIVISLDSPKVQSDNLVANNCHESENKQQITSIQSADTTTSTSDTVPTTVVPYASSCICVICLVAMNPNNVVYLANCGHGLHKHCLAQWCAISYDRKHREHHIPVIYTSNPNEYLEIQQQLQPNQLDALENDMYLHISLSNVYTMPCCPICRTALFSVSENHEENMDM